MADQRDPAVLKLGEHHITDNAVIPGVVDTPPLEDRYTQALDAPGRQPSGDVKEDERTVEEMRSRTALLGETFSGPQDGPPVVGFLASLVTGAAFDVMAGQGANYAV